jgi:hypothetical protein
MKACRNVGSLPGSFNLFSIRFGAACKRRSAHCRPRSACIGAGSIVTTHRHRRGNFNSTVLAAELIGTHRWSPVFGFQPSFALAKLLGHPDVSAV